MIFSVLAHIVLRRPPWLRWNERRWIDGLQEASPPRKRTQVSLLSPCLSPCARGWFGRIGTARGELQYELEVEECHRCKHFGSIIMLTATGNASPCGRIGRWMDGWIGQMPMTVNLETISRQNTASSRQVDDIDDRRRGILNRLCPLLVIPTVLPI